jgi:isopenicillin N synthase-like dioxygenase
MTTTQTYTTIELLTPHGPEYRRVSTAPARKPADDEIPVIDLSTLDGDLAARQTLAAKVRSAAENTGFFYVCNHGIPEEVIQGALERAQQFFAQSLEEKEKISPGAPGMDMAMGSGYRGVSSTQINKTESKGLHRSPT